MKIVLTTEEVKNIIADFVHKNNGEKKPKEVTFIFTDSRGEDTEPYDYYIDRIEVGF